jgi:hypothetical protein
MNDKDELVSLLRVCNADASAIDAVELAYELGYKAGLRKSSLDSIDMKLREEYAAGFDSAPE